MTSSATQYVELYDTYKDIICNLSPALLNAPREDAVQAFRKNGFPSRKDERYKYTDIQQAFAPNLGVNLNRIPITIDPYTEHRCPVKELSDNSYFVLNDTYCPPPAGMDLPQGVIIDSLVTIANKQPELLQPYYAQLADVQDSITALNTMLVQDGLFVYIPQGVRLVQPIQIINIAHANVDFMNNRRIVIVAEPGAEATILFCDHATEGHRFINTQVMEVYAAKESVLNLYMLEETNAQYALFNNVYVSQRANSKVTFNGLMLHNGLTRNMIYLHLQEPKAEATCYGCVVADAAQHVDNHIIVDHDAVGCTSNILYKYLLDDAAVGAFVGHVLVRQEAQQTYSEETNANMCLSPEARIYTRPMLEIYADDVKCNHGATTGQIDETALFYMQQRGIPEAEARILLQHAFINDVINRINVPTLRERLSNIVEMRFRGVPSRCKSGTGGCHKADS